MEEIKDKVKDLELALNYVCYDVDLIPKLSKVWEKLELLQEVVNKNCNIPHVNGSNCKGDYLTLTGECKKYGGECSKNSCDYYR